MTVNLFGDHVFETNLLGKVETIDGVEKTVHRADGLPGVALVLAGKIWGHTQDENALAQAGVISEKSSLISKMSLSSPIKVG
jgi:hypothetical protein